MILLWLCLFQPLSKNQQKAPKSWFGLNCFVFGGWGGAQSFLFVFFFILLLGKQKKYLTQDKMTFYVINQCLLNIIILLNTIWVFSLRLSVRKIKERKRLASTNWRRKTQINNLPILFKVIQVTFSEWEPASITTTLWGIFQEEFPQPHY